ncbi:MAG: hypothetical protein EON98_04360 [Chitinophagaceae bacterium]|nr:MAG: hypothetical protein EON98_04360 [Chitinophagaceae bacterium]
MDKEIHPYIELHSGFNQRWRYLIVGTFPPKRGCKERKDLFPFFYGNRGSFWDLLRETELYPEFNFMSIDDIKRWQKTYSIGITDVLKSCLRKPGKECSPADSNLIVNYDEDLNTELKAYVLENIDHIQKIYFTSGSEDEGSKSAYFLFAKLLGQDFKKLPRTKLVKLPSPSGEFLRSVFSKSKKDFGLKPYFYIFLKSNYPDALEVAKGTFEAKKIAPKTRINRNGKVVPLITKRFPNCLDYPSLYRIGEYKKLLPNEPLIETEPSQ